MRFAFYSLRKRVFVTPKFYDTWFFANKKLKIISNVLIELVWLHLINNLKLIIMNAG